MKNLPSILNDVLGPVMRGASSSHCAAALRIGRIVRDLMGGKLTDVEIIFDTKGSLATTHNSQGSDMGLFSGLLGYDVADERLINYKSEIFSSNINISVKYAELNDPHPNTYNLIVKNQTYSHNIKALSTGGGMIQIIEIDGAKVNIDGGYHETLFFPNNKIVESVERIKSLSGVEEVTLLEGNVNILNIKSTCKLSDELIANLKNEFGFNEVSKIYPVLPILSRTKITVPFTTAEEMIDYNKDKNLQLWQLALEYESMRGGITKDEVFDMVRNIACVIRNAVKDGLKGTEFKDRILPAQSVNFIKLDHEGKLLGSGLQNLIISYVSAIMEVKSSMGVITAAPTAGSCGACPGAICAAADYNNADEDEMIKALLIAGLIGVFIAAKSTFAAEEAGCQAETGAGAGMAAAALVYLGGGSSQQSLSAASMAIQNSLGLICDPIANRVEAPCIGRNVMAAVNALACANMAIANYLSLIPLDEVINVYDQVGRSIKRELRCTGLGGLSQTKSALDIEKKLSSI